MQPALKSTKKLITICQNKPTIKCKHLPLSNIEDYAIFFLEDSKAILKIEGNLKSYCIKIFFDKKADSNIGSYKQSKLQSVNDALLYVNDVYLQI